MRRKLSWILTIAFVLISGVTAFLAISYRQFYKRELVPWLEPRQTLWDWRWQGLKEANRALYDHWVVGDEDLRRSKRIALTFDDGPYPLYTPLLLDILKHYHVKATFFVVGIHVREYPQLARQIVADGHEIANHTNHHRRERDLSQQELMQEILDCEAAIQDVTGQRPRLFRPAGGFLTEAGIATVQKLGYTLCNATVNPGDWWQRDPDLLIRFSYRGRSREGVTLMHSGALGIVRAMPGYINALRAKGFDFVTVSELAQGLGRPLPDLPKREERSKSSGAGPRPNPESLVPEPSEPTGP